MNARRRLREALKTEAAAFRSFRAAADAVAAQSNSEVAHSFAIERERLHALWTVSQLEVVAAARALDAELSP